MLILAGLLLGCGSGDESVSSDRDGADENGRVEAEVTAAEDSGTGADKADRRNVSPAKTRRREAREDRRERRHARQIRNARNVGRESGAARSEKPAEDSSDASVELDDGRSGRKKAGNSDEKAAKPADLDDGR